MAASDDLDREAVRASRDAPHAFAAVFERHFDDLRRYLVRRVGPALGEERRLRAYARSGVDQVQRADGSQADARASLAFDGRGG